MKKYLKTFFSNDDGSELIQWAMIVAIAVMLLVVALSIGNSAKNKMESSKELIDSIDIPSADGGGEVIE